jgi:hypothetical protein
LWSAKGKDIDKKQDEKKDDEDTRGVRISNERLREENEKAGGG